MQDVYLSSSEIVVMRGCCKYADLFTCIEESEIVGNFIFSEKLHTGRRLHSKMKLGKMSKKTILLPHEREISI